MVHAVIMIRTGPGTSEDVRGAISELEGVVDVHVVAGDFDVVAELEEEAVHDVLQTATTAIQGIDGVEETKTYVALA